MQPFASILYLLFIMTILHMPAYGQLSTTPVELAVEPGEDAEFTCTWEDGANSTKQDLLTWHRITEISLATSTGNNNETAILLTNSSKVEIRRGVFVIRNVTFADAGLYKCHDNSDAAPVEVALIVYDMPSYWVEGGILLAVSAALLLVLVAGLVVQRKRAERARLEREKKKKRHRAAWLAQEK
ncbi:hypothetical protein ElyMa_006847900 [Elysia marginata]|uniref:Ig-like domain-containing protein n=1 Tax=Elysia marginata TaxID=1093978 RepID=A0AAV4J6J9_9GAST|nr:hypothetical protein ElyMa_006847900 [Elysia marginata]